MAAGPVKYTVSPIKGLNIKALSYLCHRMKVIILGYGKMGREIEKILLERGHQVHFIVERNTPRFPHDLKNADVAIEFTEPESAISNIFTCLEARVPIVVGTTGWYDRFDEVAAKVLENQGSLFTATNYSLGVNIYWQTLRYLSRLMNRTEGYFPEITEIHHTQKKDAPSGTAITTADVLLSEFHRKSGWFHTLNDHSVIPDGDSLLIKSFRENDVPGTHTVEFRSDVDTISFTHTAHSRKGFALGAVLAAEWLIGKSGVFGMKDLLNFPEEK